jgi:hypothetical protein
MINMHTQAIKIFEDAKVNKYRFPYKARQRQATSQAASQAMRLTSQATNRPTSPLTSNIQTKTLVTTASIQDSD